ncbi:hypothetical protein LTR56_012932 [Elasticomyces elasticus]|nr:hypothetical protein LTR56_012932 [Elasticomyces elasticus]KAK3667998.1 hypothetical protein LTR22_001065 [Elasticomyces elasticus]KAK4925061.1 hypothetical protein LTR49_007834 [Elasticomyces elasticus]KAK5767638.1 hypothetical protein LTS12_002139 [Elasticomyces elasticus]
MAIPTNVPASMHPTAATRVFDTAELLEMILLQIVATPDQPTERFAKTMQMRRARLADLLTCQHVNKTFNSMIRDSRLLQHALFRQTPHTTGKLPEALNPLIHDQVYKTEEGVCMSLWWQDNAARIPPSLIMSQPMNEYQPRKALVKGGRWQELLLTLMPEKVLVIRIDRRGLRAWCDTDPGATLADAVEGYTEWLRTTEEAWLEKQQKECRHRREGH